MNEVKTTVCGTEYHLLFNGYAMFAAQDMFENRQLGEIVQDNTAEGFVNLCRVFCLLAEQGELARRYEGYDRGETPDEERLRAAVMPYDVIAMRQSVLEALMRGYKRDVPEEETDLGLAELQKKEPQSGQSRLPPHRSRERSGREGNTAAAGRRGVRPVGKLRQSAPSAQAGHIKTPPMTDGA